LDAAALKGPYAIIDVIYAELSVRFTTIEALDTVLNEAGIVQEAIPPSALFLAAKLFRRYRAAGGKQTRVLPDFFIGAHTAVTGWPLLSRDKQSYLCYFPMVEVIAP
jgi:predicted nucleic acid-binding protein